jgi:transcription factor E2F7/8
MAEEAPIFRVREGSGVAAELQLQQEIIKQKILSYNRKEKSLEELSKKFIESFEGEGEVLLELDKVTQKLGVERRRIYDIVNIFESLQVVHKASKNNYVWRGLRHAVATIAAIARTPHPLLSQHKKEKSLENLAARFLQLFIASSAPMPLEDAAKVLIQTAD